MDHCCRSPEQEQSQAEIQELEPLGAASLRHMPRRNPEMLLGMKQNVSEGSPGRAAEDGS